MPAFDTNVIVRILTGDDPAQTKKAEAAFVKHTGGHGVFISMVVIAEVGWVLARGYEWTRAQIHERISRLIHTRGVVADEFELVDAALEAYAAGTADLADYLILGKAKAASGVLLTFDRKLGREKHVVML